MAVIAANITNETLDILGRVLTNNKFVRFAEQNSLELSDNTRLIRLALINLIQHIPSEDEVKRYKIALLNPTEFDDYLETKVRGKSFGT